MSAPTQRMMNPGSLSAGQGQKEMNPAALCRYGQEYVEEIHTKTMDFFQQLKALQVPVGATTNAQAYHDRKLKFEEFSKDMSQKYFRPLRLIYDTLNKDVEHRPVESLLPIEENGTVGGERPKLSDVMSHVTEQHTELTEHIRIKNRQIKEVIDLMREIIWEVNTMIAVRKTHDAFR